MTNCETPERDGRKPRAQVGEGRLEERVQLLVRNQKLWEKREGCSWEKGLKTGKMCSVPSILTMKREMRVFIRKGSGGRSWVLENVLGIWITGEGC